MIPKPNRQRMEAPGPKAMVSQLLRITPNCGYAEVKVISHVGSHHQPGDIILMSIDEFKAGRVVGGTPLTDDELYRMAPGYVSPAKPTRSKPNVNPRGKSKSKSKKAAR